jgi:CelD/BcsL family acetyltransferase involved in cellulose biosynthesis
MCDYQVFIAPIDQPIVVSDLMRRWKLSTWTSQTTAAASAISRRVVMCEGFDRYLAEMAGLGKSMRKQKTNVRLLNCDHGEVRFVSNCRDDAALSGIFDWRAQRFADQGAPWVHSVVEALYGTRMTDFSGMLSALYMSVID